LFTVLSFFIFHSFASFPYGLPVEEVARHALTIPYELLCSVSQRVPLELR